MFIFIILFSAIAFSQEDILLITLDTTRLDYINKDYSPFIYNFSQSSIVFENCRTPSPLTLPAHTSILTGLYPKNHKVRNNSSYKLDKDIKTITLILKERNFQTAVFLSSFVLNRSYGLDKGFDIYDDEMIQNQDKSDFEMQERPAKETSKKAIEFLKKSNKKEAIFLWVHFYDPHFPYFIHSEAPQSFSPYASEIYYMDIYIKELIEEFQKRRNGIIIIVGDHGESLGEHSEETHGIFLYESALKVPLIIKKTYENKKIVIEEPVSLVDIFPTILDFLKIEIPKNLDGVSLFKKIPKRNFYFETFLPSESFGWATPFGIISENFKFIYLPKKELYDLSSDPEEKNNLFDEKKEKANELLRTLKKEYTIEYKKEISKSITPKEAKELEALGYLSGSKPNQIKDPKDLIWIVKAIEDAKKLFEEKKYEKAEEIYKKILNINPENYPVLIQYGTLLREKKEIEEAIKVFQRAIILNPEFVHAHFNIGTIYYERKDFEKAKEKFLKLLELIPSFSEPYYYLIRIYLIKNDLNSAENILKKAEKNTNKDANYYFFEGLFWAQKEDFKKAIFFFEKTIEMEPSYFDAKFNLAQNYYKIGKTKEALKHFEDSLKLNPNYAQIYLIIGSIYLNDLEDLKKAKEYFQIFLSKFPNHPEASNVKEILNALTSYSY